MKSVSLVNFTSVILSYTDHNGNEVVLEPSKREQARWWDKDFGTLNGSIKLKTVYHEVPLPAPSALVYYILPLDEFRMFHLSGHRVDVLGVDVPLRAKKKEDIYPIEFLYAFDHIKKTGAVS